MLDIVLQPHPTSPEPAISRLALSIDRDASGSLRLDYRLTGQLDDIQLPRFTHLRRADRLWEHTCFELFLRGAGNSSYRELNVATSGAWAAYAFTSYREGMRAIEPFAPQIELEQRATDLHVRVVLCLDELNPEFTNAALELAPAAVIENTGGHRSYWAAHHASSKPDFHHAGAFVVTLRPS